MKLNAILSIRYGEISPQTPFEFCIRKKSPKSLITKTKQTAALKSDSSLLILFEQSDHTINSRSFTPCQEI